MAMVDYAIEERRRQQAIDKAVAIVWDDTPGHIRKIMKALSEGIKPEDFGLWYPSWPHAQSFTGSVRYVYRRIMNSAAIPSLLDGPRPFGKR